MIADLALSHFRSHRRLQMHLDGRPVALWGPNGAGKTNILEAISMLSPGRGLRRAAPGDISRRPESVGWKVAAETAGGDGAHEIETFAEGDGARNVLIDGKAATQTALGRLLRVLWLIPAMDRLWIEGAEGRRRFLDRMTLSFEPSHGDTVLTYEKAMRERNRLLKDQARDGRWYDALEQQMADAGWQIVLNRASALARITAAQGGGQSGFPAASLAVLEAEEAAGAVGADEHRLALSDGRQRDMAAGRTLTGPHRSDLRAIYAEKGIEASQCSTGEQKALLISLILSNARALREATGAPALLLLDEVAAHLDARRRAALFDEVTALGVQAWMTGTGPELFTELGDRAEAFEVSEGPDGSIVTAAEIV